MVGVVSPSCYHPWSGFDLAGRRPELANPPWEFAREPHVDHFLALKKKERRVVVPR